MLMFVSARLRWGATAVVIVIAVAAAWLWTVGQRQLPTAKGTTGSALAEHDDPSVTEKAAAAKTAFNTNKFVTSARCEECHAEQYATWHDSFHRTMTQVANDDTVVPSFDDVTLHARGRDYHLQRHGAGFFAEMVAPEWESQTLSRGIDLQSVPNPPRTTREVMMTTGSHHMQTYWVQGLDGLRHFPWFFIFDEQQWISREAVMLRPPDAPPLLPLWNVNCIKCHALGGVPGLNTDGTFDTQVAELGISCEACHGPAEQHVVFHRAQQSKTSTAITPQQAALVNPAQRPAKVASQICGQCHSSSRLVDTRDWLVHGLRYRAGGDFDRCFHLIRFFDPEFKDDEYVRDGFWGDGSCRTVGDEFLGLVESPCYQRGEISCLSCHSMHSYRDHDDQLKASLEQNDACLQCHAELRSRLTEHTHHAPDSSGSLCYNCHMPNTSYGLLKASRSHRIDSPRVQTTVDTGRPNACNLCHVDQTLEWTANRMTEWYGTPSVVLSDEQRNTSANLLHLLRGDAVQRAVAAWHMGWEPAQQASGNDWQAPFLAATLEDPYSAVRIVASRAMKKLPGFHDFTFKLDSDETQRTTARQRIVEQWRQQGPPPTSQSPAQILLDADGNVLREQLEKLREQRDNSPIQIPE